MAIEDPECKASKDNASEGKKEMAVKRGAMGNPPILHNEHKEKQEWAMTKRPMVAEEKRAKVKENVARPETKGLASVETPVEFCLNGQEKTRTTTKGLSMWSYLLHSVPTNSP